MKEFGQWKKEERGPCPSLQAGQLVPACV